MSLQNLDHLGGACGLLDWLVASLADIAFLDEPSSLCPLSWPGGISMGLFDAIAGEAVFRSFLFFYPNLLLSPSVSS